MQATTVWEIQASTGSDNNGGGYNSARSGATTDKSRGTAISRTDLVLTAAAVPAAPTVTATTGTGTLAAGTYITAITYYNTQAGTETTISVETTTVLSAIGELTVTSPAAADGCDSYRVYMTAAAGASGTEKFQATVAVGTNYVQSAAVATATAVPTINNLNYITSAATPFAASDVGNVIHLTAGTGFTVGFYEIVQFVNLKAFLDSAAGTSGSIAGTGGIGPLQTLSSIIKTSGTPIVAGNAIYAKGTFNETINVNFSGTFGNSIKLIGYTTTRSDNGYATLDGQNIRANCFVYSANIYYWTFQNWIWQGATSVTIINTANNQNIGGGSATDPIFRNCKLLKGSGTPTYIFSIVSYSDEVYIILEDCEISGPSVAIFNTSGTSASFIRCYIHDVPSTGMIPQGYASAIYIWEHSIFANITGSLIGSTNNNGGFIRLVNNTFYNCGVCDFSGTSNNFNVFVENNIFVNGTGYGIKGAGNDPNATYVKNNKYYNMTSGFISPGTAYDAGGNAVLSGNPLNADYSLNSTAGAGASCRAAGIPGAFVGLATLGYLDLGAVQHQDSGGGSTTLVINKTINNYIQEDNQWAESTV